MRFKLSPPRKDLSAFFVFPARASLFSVPFPMRDKKPKQLSK